MSSKISKGQDIIKKKNTAGKKGKKKWATKIDATVVENAIETLNDYKRKKQQQDKAQSLGFELDVNPDVSEKNKPLAKDRFKKKNHEKVMSQKLLRKIIKKSKTIKEALEQSNEALKQMRQEDIDKRNYDEKTVWDENEKSVNPEFVDKTNKKEAQKVEVKRVVVPFDGVSYNPSAKAHKELNEMAIEFENQKITYNKPEKKVVETQNLKRKRAKNQKVRLEQDIADARKQERQLNHQFLNIKKIKKELTQEEQEKEQRRQEKEEREQHEKKLQQEFGIVGYRQSKRISNLKYNFKPDVVDTEDIPENLRNVNDKGEIIREQFDSFYRRGMLEKRTFHQKNNRISRVARRKAYGVNRYMQEEDDWMDENKDILPSQMEERKKLNVQK